MMSLCWALVIFLVIFYISGMVFTLAVSHYCILDDRWKAEATEDLREYFGTLELSLLSLFMAISGGKDWGDFYDALSVLHWINPVLFIVYIWFCFIAVLNVVTGIFVENAIGSAEQDREMVIEKELSEKGKYVSNMRRLFEEMDDNASGE